MTDISCANQQPSITEERTLVICFETTWEAGNREGSRETGVPDEASNSSDIVCMGLNSSLTQSLKTINIKAIVDGI